MIKIGCAAYSYREFFKDGRMKYEDFIEEAYRIGLDGVEITLYWLPSSGFSSSVLKRLALLRGLPISCAGISTDFCSPSKSEQDRMITKVDEGLKLAEALGAPCLRIFGGQAPEGHIETKTRERVIEALKMCVCLAENQGIVLALENHHGITARADDVIEILEGVGSPWLRLNLDLGNYGDYGYDEVAKCIPYTVHIHAKMKVTGGKEKIDYEKIRKILIDGGYNGFLSIEYEEKEDPKAGVQRFASHLFELFR